MASDRLPERWQIQPSTMSQLGRGLTDVLLTFLSEVLEGCQALALLTASMKEKDSRSPCLPPVIQGQDLATAHGTAAAVLG